MEITRRQATNVAPDTMPGRGPMNEFSHIRAFPAADFKMVVRPNFDTLYSSGWLDLRDGPVVVTAPDTDGRYYMLPMLDMWTDVFASPGKRTSGTRASRWAVVAPGWEGPLPEGAERIDAPTPYVWVIGRTQTNGPQDYEAVRRVQDGFTMHPTSSAPSGRSSVEIDPSVDMVTPPLDQVNASCRGVELLRARGATVRLHPPHAPTGRSPASHCRRRHRLPARLNVDPCHALEGRDGERDSTSRRARPACAARPRWRYATVYGWRDERERHGVYVVTSSP